MGGIQLQRNSDATSAIRVQNLVGGPGFEPGASRSRTGRISCPLVSFCVLPVPRMRDTSVTRLLSKPIYTVPRGKRRRLFRT